MLARETGKGRRTGARTAPVLVAEDVRGVSVVDYLMLWSVLAAVGAFGLWSALAAVCYFFWEGAA